MVLEHQAGGSPMYEHRAAPDSLAELVGDRVLQLLELEGDERLARHELMMDEQFWSALEDGMPRADAWDMSEKMGQWTLDLIGRIAATGGSRGGRA